MHSQRTQDDPFGPRANGRVQLAGEGKRCARRARRGVGWFYPRQQGVEGRPDCVNVRACIGAAAILFNGGVTRRDAPRPGQRAGFGLIFRQTKIHQHDAATGHLFNVRRFDIAMDNGAQLSCG